MKIFIYQIISLVGAVLFGCNDILKHTKQSQTVSQCYIQSAGKINSDTMKEAVQCCLSNTFGNKRVFGVPLMQLRKLTTRERKNYERNHKNKPRGLYLKPQAYQEESPICYPSNKDELTNFFNFLNEFKGKRHAVTDNRWDCFLTEDYENKNNFCKQVLVHYKNVGIKSIRKDVCEKDFLDRKIYPFSKKRGHLLLNDIGSFQINDLDSQRMQYLDHNSKVTSTHKKRKTDQIRVFESEEDWNSREDSITTVLFPEGKSRDKYKHNHVPVIRQLECGCIRSH